MMTSTPKKYYIWSIGCQMNDADSRRVMDALEARGYAGTRTPADADVILLNTCVVRQSAEDKAVGRLTSLQQIKRSRPDALVAVMGCLVGDDPEAMRRRFPHVDLFMAPSRPEPLFALLDSATDDDVRGRRPASPVSAYLPISFGCDHHCTYCIVRIRRGPHISRPIEELRAEAVSLVERGAREITLLGQNVDAYGADLPGRPDLSDLLDALHDIPGLLRLRFLTSHPAEMGRRIVDAVARLPKVCEHIELPVQAGSDSLLRRMARHYTVAGYRELVGEIRAAIPGVSLGTDVIVGFCGETEEEFAGTRALVEELRFDDVHIAAYSVRPGTPASRLPDDVPPDVKEARRKKLEAIQERIATEANGRLLGETVEVLVEEQVRGRWRGRTRHNKLVFFEDSRQLAGQLVHVRITWAGPWSMVGDPHPFPSPKGRGER